MRTRGFIYLVANEEAFERRLRTRLSVADPHYDSSVFIRTLRPQPSWDPAGVLSADLQEALARFQTRRNASGGTIPAGETEVPCTVVMAVDLGDDEIPAFSLGVLHAMLQDLAVARMQQPQIMGTAVFRILAIWPPRVLAPSQQPPRWAWLKEVHYLVRGKYLGEEMVDRASATEADPVAGLPEAERDFLGRGGQVSDLFILGRGNWQAARNPDGIETLAPGADRSLQWACAAEILVQMVLRRGLDEAMSPLAPNQRTRLYACGVSSVGYEVEAVKRAFAAHRLAEMLEAYVRGEAEAPTTQEIETTLTEAKAENIKKSLKHGGIGSNVENEFESVFTRILIKPDVFSRPPGVPDLEWSLELPYRIRFHQQILEQGAFQDSLRRIEGVRGRILWTLKEQLRGLVDRWVGVVPKEGAGGADGLSRIARVKAGLRGIRRFLREQLEQVETLRFEEALQPLLLHDDLWDSVEAGPGVVDRYYNELVEVVRNQPLPEAVRLRAVAFGLPFAVGVSLLAELNQYLFSTPLIQIGWFGAPAVVFFGVGAIFLGFREWSFWRYRKRIDVATRRLVIAIVKDFRERLTATMRNSIRSIYERLIALTGDPDEDQGRDPASETALVEDWAAVLTAAQKELSDRRIVLPPDLESPFFHPVRPPETEIGYGEKRRPFAQVRHEELSWLIREPRHPTDSEEPAYRFNCWRILARDDGRRREAVTGWVEDVAVRGYGFLDELPLCEVLALLPESDRSQMESRMLSASFPFADLPPYGFHGQVGIIRALVCEPEAKEAVSRLLRKVCAKEEPLDRSPSSMAPVADWKAVTVIRLLGGLTWKDIPEVGLWREQYGKLAETQRRALHHCAQFAAEECLDPLNSEDGMDVQFPPTVPVDDDMRL